MKFEDYQFIDTPELLEALDKHLMDGDEPRFQLTAIDTETNGLLFYRNVIIGFSISTDTHGGFYVPLLTWVPDKSSLKTKSIKKVKHEVYEKGHFKCVWTGETYPEDVTQAQYQAPDAIKTLAERWFCSGTQLLLHNAPFDAGFIFYNFGVDIAEHIFCDTQLLKHFIDETTPKGLKETGELWARELGFDAKGAAKAEQKELGTSIVRNGGTFNQRTKHVWRGDYEPVGKYAIKDTALTYGLFEVGLQKLEKDFEPKHFELFFETEIMPVCREVVIPMQYGGVYISVPDFEILHKEVVEKMDELEDIFMEKIDHLLENFPLGKSVDEVVSKKALVEKMIDIEGLEYPTKAVKGETKKSLAKDAVKKAYDADPHWLWSYVLGEGELQYTDEELAAVKQMIYEERTGKRYRFNVGSRMHLRWLIFDKLGYDQSKYPQTKSATKQNPIASMTADILEEHFADNHDFLKPLMVWFKLQKLRGTYIEPALALHNKCWLHMNSNQSGTISGRFSCSGGYNLQTLPRVEDLSRCGKCESKNVTVEHPIRLLAHQTCGDCGHVAENIICSSAIKAAFIAPPGYKIVSADYSSLEPRCFAQMSSESKLKDVFRLGLDFYSKMFVDILDKENKYSAHPDDPNFLKTQNPAARAQIKPVALSIPYGSLEPQVAVQMDFKTTKHFKDKETGEMVSKTVLDVQRGKEFRDQYLQTYPKLAEYMKECEDRACVHGFVESILGRRRHFTYAPYIYQLLTSLNIDRDEFVRFTRKKLEETPEKLGLTKKALERFAIKFGMEIEDVYAKGGWRYVKSLFKGELDNAKNVRIQGLAAHVTNRGMLETQRYSRDAGMDAYICLSVHDELIGYAKADQAEDYAALMQTGMEDNLFTRLIDVPMIAEPVICNSLKEAK